jgi:hypothetical protein
MNLFDHRGSSEKIVSENSTLGWEEKGTLALFEGGEEREVFGTKKAEFSDG